MQRSPQTSPQHLHLSHSAPRPLQQPSERPYFTIFPKESSLHAAFQKTKQQQPLLCQHRSFFSCRNVPLPEFFPVWIPLIMSPSEAAPSPHPHASTPSPFPASFPWPHVAPCVRVCGCIYRQGRRASVLLSASIPQWKLLRSMDLSTTYYHSHSM